MHVTGIRVAMMFAALGACLAHADSDSRKGLTIPAVVTSAKRTITVDDVMALRSVTSLTISPDGTKFSIFVRQADPAANEYRTAWFVGSSRGGQLTKVGDGGLLRPKVTVYGELDAPYSRWSPDGRWIAYQLRHDDEVQLWRSSVDGIVQEQLTHNSADVLDFVWAPDGRAIYFTTAQARADLQARREAKARGGYSYDEDLYAFTDLMKPEPLTDPNVAPEVWTLTLTDAQERPATEKERSAYARARAEGEGAIEEAAEALHDTDELPAQSSSGASVWLKRLAPLSRFSTVAVSLPGRRSTSKVCQEAQCKGVVYRAWWMDKTQSVLIWRGEGINDRVHAFYVWSPTTNAVSTVSRAPDADLRLCDKAADDLMICVRETSTQPPHLAALNLRTGDVRILTDINPEFRNIRLGRIERIEWDTPKLSWNEPGGELAGLYPKRAYGYILYPPDFDPTKKYPAIIDPYVAFGFDRLDGVGNEHPLHVYAAAGFIALKLEFPQFIDLQARLGPRAMKELYSAELDFPHLTMLMESTLRGLDTAVARGFIDPKRVGIGGVSHGTFVPLYMMLKYDRIAAISISSPTWGTHGYYWTTRRGRGLGAEMLGKAGHVDWTPKPEGAGREFWRRIDIADHVEAVEAPVLMQLADYETYALIRFIRHLADANKPYDAYVFPHETHIKWQPAHLRAIQLRNLDWFRFWLQDQEDPDPSKARQYTNWRELKAHRADDRLRTSQNGER
jgi:dipeptidyl aminopeptidase/acylaminoacyl peptidase